MKILHTWAKSHLLAHEVRDQFRPDAKAIVIGHTHRALVHEQAGKHVINTGAFLTMAKALVVDITDGRMTVLDQPPHIRTRLMTLYIVFMFIGGGLGSWTGTIAYDLFGWPGTTGLAAILSVLVVCLAYFALRRAAKTASVNTQGE